MNALMENSLSDNSCRYHSNIYQEIFSAQQLTHNTHDIVWNSCVLLFIVYMYTPLDSKARLSLINYCWIKLAQALGWSPLQIWKWL